MMDVILHAGRDCCEGDDGRTTWHQTGLLFSCGKCVTQHLPLVGDDKYDDILLFSLAGR